MWLLRAVIIFQKATESSRCQLENLTETFVKSRNALTVSIIDGLQGIQDSDAFSSFLSKTSIEHNTRDTKVSFLDARQLLIAYNLLAGISINHVSYFAQPIGLKNISVLFSFHHVCHDQSHYIKVAQGGVSRRHNWLWIFSIFWANKWKYIKIKSFTKKIMQLFSEDATIFLKIF